MKVLVFVACLLAPLPVLAQTPTPEVQALGQKLMAEINANIQCTTAGISLQQQLVAAQAQIKALQDKYEKPEEKK